MRLYFPVFKLESGEKLVVEHEPLTDWRAAALFVEETSCDSLLGVNDFTVISVEADKRFSTDITGDVKDLLFQRWKKRHLLHGEPPPPWLGEDAEKFADFQLED